MVACPASRPSFFPAIVIFDTVRETGVARLAGRMLDSVLELEWSNARRTGQPLSLIMLDIDYFKQYNDHYGHVQGDDCLKQVAAMLRKAAVRHRDFLARYGGEEFLLVLPETDAAAAATVAERCRNLVFKAQIAHAASPVSPVLTVSLGVDTIIPGSQDRLEAFIEQVDRQLYQAKLCGRNRIAADTG